MYVGNQQDTGASRQGILEQIKENSNFREMSVIGALMGTVMGIVAGFDFINTAQLAIKLAAVLVILQECCLLLQKVLYRFQCTV